VNKTVITIEPIEGLIRTDYRWEIRWPSGGQSLARRAPYESAVTEVTAALSSYNPYSDSGS
jgi:hypothetical protein